MLRLAAIVVVASVPIVAAASAAEVSDKIDIKATPDKTWAAIGAFCDINKWHPAVASCELTSNAGKKIRTLTTKDGAKIVEQELARDDSGRSYSYAILESPLPVADYKSTIKVEPGASGGSSVVWSSTFEPKGAPEEDAKKVISGIYVSGLDNLKVNIEGK